MLRTRVKVLVYALIASVFTFCFVAYDLQISHVIPNINKVAEIVEFNNTSSKLEDSETTVSPHDDSLDDPRDERQEEEEDGDGFKASETADNANTFSVTRDINADVLNSSSFADDHKAKSSQTKSAGKIKSSSNLKNPAATSVTRNVTPEVSSNSSAAAKANNSSERQNSKRIDRVKREKLRALRQMFKRQQHLFKTKNVDCSAVFRRNKAEIAKARKVAASPKRLVGIPDAHYEQATKNCSQFVRKRGYITVSLSKEEDDFPIAYSLLVYKDLEMVERLLRAIYRPQNYYCLHIDAGCRPSFFRAASSLASCFPNVHLTSQRVDVTWGEFSVLKPELMCMRELWRFRKWKYYINLTGQEFPLKTNLEIVRILKAYRGASDVEGTLKHANPERWKNTMPPHGLQPYKGSVHVAVNREFVRHIMKDPKTQDLLKWTRKTEIPDETLFATMNHNPSLGIKGSYNGNKMETKPTLTRFKNWFGSRPCAWRSVRDICILTVGDLPLLFEARHLFANKFYLSHDRVVIECLEEKNFNRTRAGVFGQNRLVDDTYYSNVEFVKNQIT